MTNSYNYIIVGQGIAGTVLAATLIKEGKTVLVIDVQSLSQSSRIAAGLYNPVVFKRLVKSWLADDLIPVMDSFYADAEELLNTKFYFKKKIVKLFAEENEKTFWIKKTNEEVGKYLSKDIHDHYLSELVYSPYGAAEVIDAGNLNTSLFLSSYRNYLKEGDSLLEEEFDYNQLIISDNFITYKNINADKIIFCEGYKCTSNPYFNWLPFKLTKGEVLTIKIPEHYSEQIKEEQVINKGVFILPIGNRLYKVGATYEWTDLTEHPTEKGKTDLINKLNKVFKFPFEIVNHESGIRPTVNDRRPLIGLHPKHSTLGVFNGMGTKGVMLAPYFAQQFINYLKGKEGINKEVDIARLAK
jgi:glycine/D-amino acid oxidase-like deaminating enzyme